NYWHNRLLPQGCVNGFWGLPSLVPKLPFGNVCPRNSVSPQSRNRSFGGSAFPNRSLGTRREARRGRPPDSAHAPPPRGEAGKMYQTAPRRVEIRWSDRGPAKERTWRTAR